jgi:hypothetical protein
LNVGDLHQNRGFDALRVIRKGGRREALAINPQAAQRIRAYLEQTGHGDQPDGPLFRPLRADEVRQLLASHRRELGLDLPVDSVGDPDCVAAIIRITAGNFRLINRLLSQVERILRINGLSAVTPAVIDAAREGLVIGTA